MPVACVCLHCGASFSVDPYKIREGRGKYCSVYCYHHSERPSRTAEERFWSHVLKTEECWLWQAAITNKGYGHFNLRAGELILAHRFAYQLTYGPIMPELFCCHHCDTPACVRPEHLFLGTNSDNMRDMFSKGRSRRQTHPESRPRGTTHGMAKLTEDQVREIRALYATGQWRHSGLALTFGVSQTLIGDIIRRRIWKHVE